MLELITGSGRGSRPSWWARRVVPDTHREPDREDDPVIFFRALAVLLVLSVPLWAVILLLLSAVWR
jgi:hypothetical protein